MRAVQLHGDHEAFARLVRRWEAPIRDLCSRMTGDRHYGEDLSQEVFARVYTYRKQFDLSRRFSTWVWRIAVKSCLNHGRQRTRYTFNFEDAIDKLQDQSNIDDTPDSALVKQESAEIVARAVLHLPPANQAVLMLREYEGLKFREIADVLEIPEGTVKWRMAEALRELSEYLKDKFPERATPSP